MCIGVWAPLCSRTAGWRWSWPSAAGSRARERARKRETAFESHRARTATLGFLLQRETTLQECYRVHSRGSHFGRHALNPEFVQRLNAPPRLLSISILGPGCQRGTPPTYRPTGNEPEWGPCGPRRFVSVRRPAEHPPGARTRERGSSTSERPFGATRGDRRRAPTGADRVTDRKRPPFHGGPTRKSERTLSTEGREPARLRCGGGRGERSNLHNWATRSRLGVPLSAFQE